MNNDRIAAIRARCEREKAVDAMGRKANGVYLYTVPLLLTEIDRLTAELAVYRATELSPEEFKEAVGYALELNKKCHEATGCTAEEISSMRSQLAASQRREQAAVEAINRMAEYIVTKGRVDYWLCDEIPQEIHLKHQPKDDGHYDNAPCIKCVAEYFTSGPQEGGE